MRRRIFFQPVGEKLFVGLVAGVESSQDGGMLRARSQTGRGAFRIDRILGGQMLQADDILDHALHQLHQGEVGEVSGGRDATAQPTGNFNLQCF